MIIQVMHLEQFIYSLLKLLIIIEMSRTSLGQRNQMVRREEPNSLKQVSSGLRPNQDKLFQPHLNLLEELETFLFMKDKYFKIERETQYLGCQLGESYSSIKDGFGIYVFKNGDRYVGEWKNKTMDGLGMYIFFSPDPLVRTIYLGDFLKGKFHGFGKLADFNDNIGRMIYNGQWVEGKKARLGLHYYQQQQSYYCGAWSNDLKHGEGKLVFPNGEYNGNWEANYRHGFGRLRKQEKGFTLLYEGVWEHDQLHSGKVVYYDFQNTQVGRYEGDLVDGKKHGRGTYYWRNTLYEGEFYNDFIKGTGFFRIGKHSFRGEFFSDYDLMNCPELKGQITYDNGDQYDGILSIQEGKVMRKRGLYQFSIGDSADGQFIDNHRGELKGHFVYRWRNGDEKQFG